MAKRSSRTANKGSECGWNSRSSTLITMLQNGLTAIYVELSLVSDWVCGILGIILIQSLRTMAMARCSFNLRWAWDLCQDNCQDRKPTTPAINLKNEKFPSVLAVAGKWKIKLTFAGCCCCCCCLFVFLSLSQFSVLCFVFWPKQMQVQSAIASTAEIC